MHKRMFHNQLFFFFLYDNVLQKLTLKGHLYLLFANCLTSFAMVHSCVATQGAAFSSPVLPFVRNLCSTGAEGFFFWSFFSFMLIPQNLIIYQVLCKSVCDTCLVSVQYNPWWMIFLSYWKNSQYSQYSVWIEFPFP